MWRISERERTILHNLLVTAEGGEGESRSEEDVGRLWKTPVEFEKRNGEVVSVSLEDVMKVGLCPLHPCQLPNHCEFRRTA